MRLLVRLAALTLLVSQCRASGSTSTSPAFFWGSGGLGLGASRTVLEAVPSRVVVDGILHSLVTGRVEASARQYLQQPTARPGVVAVFVSKQLAAQQQTLSQLAGELEPLQGTLEAAPASLTLPHVAFKGAPDVARAVLRSVAAPGGSPAATVLGDCGGSAGSVSGEVTVEAFRAAVEGGPGQKVVVVCPSAPTLAAETALFASLHAALGPPAAAAAAADSAPPQGTLAPQQRGGSSSYAWAYLAQPSGAALAEARRRALLEGQGNPAGFAGVGKKGKPQYVCDAKCETQVKLLEGLILAFNVILAVWVGSWMLHQLGTPTRFETPKDTGGQQRDS